MKSRFELALLLLRIIVVWRLVGGSWRYVFNVKPVSEIVGYFSALHLPLPQVTAYLSLYVQFFGGLFILLGLFFNKTCLLIAFNFAVAIIAAHISDPIEKSFPAFILFASAIVLSISGSGKYALSNLIKTKFLE